MELPQWNMYGRCGTHRFWKKMGIFFFAGMIMFAFVLSLFPLAVIREKVRWIRYALVDGAVFALVCLGMNGVCRLKFEQKSSGRATCLIDHLLLCGRMRDLAGNHLSVDNGCFYSCHRCICI